MDDVWFKRAGFCGTCGSGYLAIIEDRNKPDDMVIYHVLPGCTREDAKLLPEEYQWLDMVALGTNWSHTGV